jgi:ribokinase
LQAASAAKQRGITVCLNAAPARELSAQMQACIDLLVVNAVEARDLCGIGVNDLDSALCFVILNPPLNKEKAGFSPNKCR